MSKYAFNVDRIVNYLKNYKDTLPIIYTWEVNIDPLVELEIISSNEADRLRDDTPYLRALFLKERINYYLLKTINNDQGLFNKLCIWIIRDWGGIKTAKDDKTIELIKEFLEHHDNPSYKRIASSSKIGSFMFPEENIIYDSRVAYALNWILLSEDAGEKYFPIPSGRNSKMMAFDMNVLIHLKNINLFQPNSQEELKNKYISKKDKCVYIEKKRAYTELNQLIKEVSKKLWDGDLEKSRKLFYTEMLLFSIADREVFMDITKRLTLNIESL